MTLMPLDIVGDYVVVWWVLLCVVLMVLDRVLGSLFFWKQTSMVPC